MTFFNVCKLSLDLLAVPFDVYRSIKALQKSLNDEFRLVFIDPEIL